MGPFGVQEMIAVFVIALILFGPKKLPELGRTLGKALSEFRRAKNELKSTFESHLSELEREARIETTPITSNTSYSTAPYSYPYDEYGQYDSCSDCSSKSHETNDALAIEASQPPTASATAIQDAEAHRDNSSSQNAPVADTVARTNGAQPIEPVPAFAKEEHPV